jgi:ubiquinone biosynthesis protein
VPNLDDPKPLKSHGMSRHIRDAPRDRVTEMARTRRPRARKSALLYHRGMSDPNTATSAPGVRIGWRAVSVGLRLMFAVLRFGFGWIGLRLRASGPAAREKWLGRCVASLFRDLGATFIKIGQIMSTRPDLLPDAVVHALEGLQDNVGPFPFRDACATIEADLGRPLHELFVEIAPCPVASASIAQVHRARLPGGRVVAIKVRRPGVVKLCEFDLSVLRLGARIGSWLPGMKTLDPVGTVDQFARAVRAQLDLRGEAVNNRRFRANFSGQSDTVFPELVDSHCSERVLTMSYVEGTKIFDIGDLHADPGRIARTGLRTLMKMIFVDGFVHADMHPGNLRVTPDGKLAIFDLGLVGELSLTQRQLFARYFAAWAQRDGDTMGHLMIEISAGKPPGKDRFEHFRADTIAFVGRYWGRRLGDVQLASVLFDLLALLRRHRIRVPSEFTTVLIAVAMTEGVGKRLDPTLDLMTEALPFFLTNRPGTATSTVSD